MSDLYNDGRYPTSNQTDVTEEKEKVSARELHFQEFREFDYGLDIKDNIILVQDEISQGMVFDC